MGRIKKLSEVTARQPLSHEESEKTKGGDFVGGFGPVGGGGYDQCSVSTVLSTGGGNPWPPTPPDPCGPACDYFYDNLARSLVSMTPH